MNQTKIGLFGFGTVGQGVYTVVRNAPNAHAEIKRICVRDVSKPREVEVDASLLTTESSAILEDPEIDLVVELIDDAEEAYRIACEALKHGKPVVSGNKAMIARHLPELMEMQKEYGVPFLYDASSCGSIPVIRNLEEYYDNDLLLEVKGILNGSTNYILSRVFDHGEDYASALRRAQECGFAESDPSKDVDGIDSLYKLIIITVHALGVYVAPEEIFTYGISGISDFDIRYAREKRVKIKLVAQVAKVSAESFTMFVMPEFVEKSRYIYSVDDEYNGVVIRGECYDRQFMFGKGAGSLPTASSILSDMMALRHDYRYEYKKSHYSGLPVYDREVLVRVYIRYRESRVVERLPLRRIRESYTSEENSYVIADIMLSDLMEHRDFLSSPDIFLVNIPIFFDDSND